MRSPHPRPSDCQYRSSSASAADVPRVFRPQSRSEKSKAACNVDLNSCAFFANLNATTATATQEHSSAGLPASLKTQPVASQSSDLTSQPDTVDDHIWTDCKTDIDTLEATLNKTFKPTDVHRFLFGDDLNTAEKAFKDAKAAIRRASKRLTYYWDREYQLAKLRPMLEAQILLGQRIRAAWAAAMERKEEVLDKILEDQVTMGSKEMDELLDSLDPSWFETDWEPIDHV